jgi:hypothetical protein
MIEPGCTFTSQLEIIVLYPLNLYVKGLSRCYYITTEAKLQTGVSMELSYGIFKSEERNLIVL